MVFTVELRKLRTLLNRLDGAAQSGLEFADLVLDLVTHVAVESARLSVHAVEGYADEELID